MSWLLHLLKSKKGVTLIELLVVVVILGIIAAVTIPMVTSNQDTAFANSNAQNLAIVQEAVTRYMIDNNGDLPKDDDVVDFDLLVPNYLTEEPVIHFGDESKRGKKWVITADGRVSLPSNAK